MRHYDREHFRHLDDSERYRDYEYLGDDAWVGPNERIPSGATTTDQPPWSTKGGWASEPFAIGPTFDDRGQGREYGRDLGLGYGRDHDAGRTFERTGGDDYDRGYARPRSMEDRQEYPREQRFDDRPPQEEERGGLVHDILHPAAFVRRVANGVFRGRGPKGWVRSDARIHDEVCERLARDPYIDASDIEVTVEKGEVTLAGQVDDRRTKRYAEEILDDVLGVEDVHNRLRIAPRR